MSHDVLSSEDLLAVYAPDCSQWIQIAALQARTAPLVPDDDDSHPEE